jgi:glycosyltransferase involved in cell wall biosynthesis
MKVLFLTVSPRRASYRYRIEQFLPFWKDYNIKATNICVVGLSFFKKITLAKSCTNYDCVILQRKALSPFLIRIIKKQTKLVYDFDDALYAREPYVKGRINGTQPGSKGLIKRLNYILKKSDAIIGGSKDLCSYSKQFNPNVHLIPTSLPLPQQQTVNKSDVVKVGWIGNKLNLYYLEMIDEALFEIQTEFPEIVFEVMCNALPDNCKTSWKLVEWAKDKEHEWLSSISIGLMPLVDDDWSRGKCAFKLLQYMSHKKPVVGSNVGANKDAIKHAASGFLAANNKDWFDHLKILIKSKEKQSEMGLEGFKHFKNEYELHSTQQKLAKLLKSFE